MKRRIMVAILAGLLTMLACMIINRYNQPVIIPGPEPTPTATPTPKPALTAVGLRIEPHPLSPDNVLKVDLTARPEPTPEPTPEPEPAYTEEELELLALVIYQEAGGDACSDETRLRVGAVALNRVAHPDFPDTLYDVVTEERAYGELFWTGPVWPKRASWEGEAHAVARAYDIAKRVLEGERVLPEDVIFQSEYIMGEIVAQSDGMYFCRAH